MWTASLASFGHEAAYHPVLELYDKGNIVRNHTYEVVALRSHRWTRRTLETRGSILDFEILPRETEPGRKPARSRRSRGGSGRRRTRRWPVRSQRPPVTLHNFYNGSRLYGASYR